MDFRRPVQAVVPGAQGRVLAVLAETTGELSLRTVARLVEVSPAQASRILPGLARPLREAGLSRVTVSLDSLDPGRFQELSGARGSVAEADVLEAASAEAVERDAVAVPK